MNDPRSLLAAVKKKSSSTTTAPGADIREKPRDSLTIDESAARCGADAHRLRNPENGEISKEDGDRGVADALGVSGGAVGGGAGRRTGRETLRDIRLAGGLSGLSTSGVDGDGCSASSNGAHAKGARTSVIRDCKAPLIAEISPPNPSSTETGEPCVPQTRCTTGYDGGDGERSGKSAGGGSAVKKGFLSNVGKKGGAAPLYPPAGSENGAEASAYVKLMSRSKVVDTRGLSKQGVCLCVALRHQTKGMVPVESVLFVPTLKEYGACLATRV